MFSKKKQPAAQMKIIGVDPQLKEKALKIAKEAGEVIYALGGLDEVEAGADSMLGILDYGMPEIRLKSVKKRYVAAGFMFAIAVLSENAELLGFKPVDENNPFFQI